MTSQELDEFERGSCLCVDLLCRVMLNNPHRGELIWSMLNVYFKRLVGEDAQQAQDTHHQEHDKNTGRYAPPAPPPPPAAAAAAAEVDDEEEEPSQYIVRDRMPLLNGRIVMCVMVCLHRMLYLQGGMANLLLNALEHVVRRIPLDESSDSRHKRYDFTGS